MSKKRAAKRNFEVDWGTCIHEASHAVMAYALGQKVDRIVITGTGEGFCQWQGEPSLIERGLVSIAGSCGEHLWALDEHASSLPNVDSFSSGDVKHLVKDGFTYRDLVLLRDYAKPILRRFKKQVFAVARRLLIKDIKRAEFVRIVLGLE